MIETVLDGEVLIFDTSQNAIHSLNAQSAEVWRLIDGSLSVARIAALLPLAPETNSIDIVWTALLQFEGVGLLDSALPVIPDTTRLGRRHLMRRAAVAASIPVIVSVSAPMATAASTGEAPTCINPTCGINSSGSPCVCSYTGVTIQPGVLCYDPDSTMGYCLEDANVPTGNTRTCYPCICRGGYGIPDEVKYPGDFCAAPVPPPG